MAASASLSSAFFIVPHNRFSICSSRPTKFIYGCPISTKVFYTSPPLNCFLRNGELKIIELENKRLFRARPSVSAEQESQPYQAHSEDGSGTKRQPFDLKFLLHIYKEAILYGDGKTVREIEDMISIMDKESKDLANKISNMSAEISSRKEKYLRLQADFDNYRKRSEKERTTVRSSAHGEVIETLLPMVDSFEKAKQQIKPETEKEKNIDTSYQGIYKQFVEIMRSLRVTVVPTVGKPFDPSMHEAIAREESHEFKDGTIIQEFRRGFHLGDRLLRPAVVKVSSGPGKRKPPLATEKLSEQTQSTASVRSPY